MAQPSAVHGFSVHLAVILKVILLEVPFVSGRVLVEKSSDKKIYDALF